MLWVSAEYESVSALMETYNKQHSTEKLLWNRKRKDVAAYERRRVIEKKDTSESRLEEFGLGLF